MKNIEYFIGQKLYLEINMIGYKTMGESIILSLKSSDTTVLWTAIIDCYKYDNLNITYDTLKEMGYGNDKKIDLLCITHPDEDHTKDIKMIMNDFTNNNTIYLMPDFLASNIDETNDIKEIRKIISDRYSRHSDGRLNNIFYNRNINEPNLNWKFIGSDNKTHILRIETYLPTDSIMTMSRNNNNQYKNDYSLFINLIIDDKNNYVFTGDCMDYSIVCLEEEDLQKMNKVLYFKIPHHGSDIKKMQELIINNRLTLYNVSACAYRKGTTQRKILDFYNENCEDVSITFTDTENIKKYGLLKHVFDATNGILVKDKCIALGGANLKY